MAQPTNLSETTDTTATSMREDLANSVEMLLPTETPFYTAIGRGTATNTFHEWQTASLAAGIATNVVEEGDAASIDAAKATVRVGNYCQISDKTVAISGTQMAVTHAGIQSMKGWQLLQKSRELKKDLDARMCANKASVLGLEHAAGTPREAAGYGAMIYTNSSCGAGGATTAYAGGLWVVATDGTDRALIEDYLQDVLTSCYDNGGTPTLVICGSFNKRKISGFTGGATRTDRSEDKKLTNTIEVYIGDFGSVDIVPSRQCPTDTVLVVDPEMWKLCFLRNYQTKQLPFAGDAEQWQLLCEFTLEACNEASSGTINDLTTS